MRLAHTIATLALAGTFGGLALTVSANAQPAPQGHYCDHNYYFQTTNCAYHSWDQCLRFALPNGGFCSVNHSAYYQAKPYGHGMTRRG